MSVCLYVCLCACMCICVCMHVCNCSVILWHCLYPQVKAEGVVILIQR